MVGGEGRGTGRIHKSFFRFGLFGSRIFRIDRLLVGFGFDSVFRIHAFNKPDNMHPVKKLMRCNTHYAVCKRLAVRSFEKAFVHEGFLLERLRRLTEVMEHEYVAGAA